MVQYVSLMTKEDIFYNGNSVQRHLNYQLNKYVYDSLKLKVFK